MSTETITIETIKITDLKPARYNPRQISNEDYNKLSNSINEYGLVDPIIINLNNYNIIGGNQRYDVLLSEHIAGNTDYNELLLIKNGDIGWVFPDNELEVKDLNHEKSLNIMLNSVGGEFDPEKLTDLFNELSIEGLDLSLTGWDKNEIRELSKDIDLSTFGQEEIDLEESLAEEENTKEVSHSKNRKEITCPNCGHVFMEQEIIDMDDDF